MAKIKLRITESQYGYIMENSRLDFLKKQFGVISNEEWEELSKKDLSRLRVKQKTSDEEGEKVNIVNLQIKPLMSDDKLLALYIVDENGKVKVRVSNYVFEMINEADPTTKKIYTQWLLTLFVNLIKRNELEDATRFVTEDLPEASDNLKTFDEVKNTKLFKKVVDKIEGLPNDPTNINQYESIGQLFNAVKYFIEGSETSLLNKIKQFVSAGEAKVLYQDSEWIIYEPLTRDANTVFEKPLSTWCTAQPGNSFFNRYTSEDRQPDGKVSRIYDIVSKDALKGESNEIYQFHFESNNTNGQFKDYTNKDINVTEFWRRNPNIANFFKKIITPLAMMGNFNLKTNPYIKSLLAMGETENIFDFIDTESKKIYLAGITVNKLPNTLDRFTEVIDFLAPSVGLNSLPDSIGGMTKLEILQLNNNNLETLPDSICNIKGLSMIALEGNPIKRLPECLANLDELFSITLSKNIPMSQEDRDKLVEMLPTVKIIFK